MVYLMISGLLIIFARVIEARRDAIDFEVGADPMNFEWHILKYPQFIALFAAGYAFSQEWLWLAVGLVVAWITFEYSLKWFRKQI